VASVALGTTTPTYNPNGVTGATPNSVSSVEDAADTVDQPQATQFSNFLGRNQQGPVRLSSNSVPNIKGQTHILKLN